jgi:acyl-[acyl carrier protein]--UDP-N-acetylglucosamine O-acyltransferase
VALDYGITEAEFWDMTLGEIKRATKSKARMMKIQAQEKAGYDYILASLIVKGFSKVMGGEGEYPALQDAYPDLFKDSEAIAEKQNQIEEQKTNLSVLRFKQFANFHNNKYKEVASDK